jgi:hypothetical protein
MMVLRKTMDAAIEAERQRYADLANRFGLALQQTNALQCQLAEWITEKAEAQTPEQAAALFYSHDDRWQAAFFNCLQAVIAAHHDALPADQVWGKCPGVPAGEAQWWHMSQHLDHSDFETLEAMFDHAKSAREKVAA